MIYSHIPCCVLIIAYSYDAACHLAEEMPHSARDVPIAMVRSVAVNGMMDLGYCIMLLYSLGDLDDCKHILFRNPTLLIVLTRE